MPYPTGMLSLTLEDIDRQMSELKRYATAVKNEAAAGNIPSSRVVDLFVNLKQTRESLVAAGATPGIAAYAQAQKNTPGLDVVAEFNGVITAIDNVTNWLLANYPKDAAGFLLSQTWGPTGPQDRTFDANATVGLRTLLNALSETIN